MKYTLFNLLMISSFFISCTDPDPVVADGTELSDQPEKQTDSSDTYFTYDEIPFEMILSIEQIKGADYFLVIDIDVCKGCYYASPNSNNSFKGLLAVELDEINNVVKEDVFSEDPVSVPSPDPFSNEMVNRVEVRTVYRQKLTVINEGDFEIKGSTAFVVEPVCSRYLTEFVLKNKGGELTILKGDTRIANID